MKTVKEVSALTGVSIRTLRYYDEIGLLKPTRLTASGYRMYDNKALERLQEIMFFRELEVPLHSITEILDNPDYNKKQVLQTQKAFLERKRNRLNGLIELITDVLEGVNTMSFEAFSDVDIQKIVDHTLACMSEEALEEQVKAYGSIENYKEHLSSGFHNEQVMADLIRWYGDKEKAVEAVLQADGQQPEIPTEQDENERLYKQFMVAREKKDSQLERETVELLAENYKRLFRLDNARNILIDLASEYLSQGKLAEVTDEKYGEGCAEYVAKAIQLYYGV